MPKHLQNNLGGNTQWCESTNLIVHILIPLYALNGVNILARFNESIQRYALVVLYIL